MPQPLVPNQFVSDVQYLRFHHRDLESLSDRDLWRELWRVQDTLAYDDNASAWLWERFSMLMQEQKRRAKEDRRHAARG